MISFVKKLREVSQIRTTYRAGLLQDKAYRVLKRNTASALETYKISTVEWAYLGFIYDNPKGVRLITVAKTLGVEAPFVTDITNKFLFHGTLVTTEADLKDKRAKLVKLSDTGRNFVDEVEIFLKQKIKPLLEDISPIDLAGYLSVLSRIVENSSKDRK